MSVTEVTNTTATDAETYDSSSLAQFVWRPNPLGNKGFLHVEFQSGGQYIYMGVPKTLAEELQERAHNPERYANSVGEFFYNNIRNEFSRRGTDYAEL